MENVKGVTQLRITFYVALKSPTVKPYGCFWPIRTGYSF